MILVSTLRKLAAKDATIFQVTNPAFRVTVPGLERDIPGSVEVFATRRQAEHVASSTSAVIFGAPHAPTVEAVQARDVATDDAIIGALFGTLAPVGIARDTA